ncbi:MAG: hypothetical protein ACJ76J_02575 [Thermoanaerobaculia bacterium]
MATLYAWANPLSLWQGADHTWITNYPSPFQCPPTPDYWYCWGICHPAGPGTTARPLGSAQGDISFASCICTPNDPNAHGGIDRYGIEGVCHQLANRVLYATSPYGTPLTVKGAHKYWLSHLLFGTYGTTLKDWAARKKKCQPGTIAAMGNGDTEDPDSLLFEQMVRSSRGPAAAGEDPMAAIEALRAELLAEKAPLDAAVQAGTISGDEFANRVNELVSSYLPRIAEILGPNNCARIFEASPGETVQVLDPEIASRTDYTGGTTSTPSGSTPSGSTPPVTPPGRAAT